MNDSTFCHFVATSHALGHSDKKEPWFCQCIACRFTKEYKIEVLNEDGTTRETTIAEAVVKSLNQQGHEICLPTAS